MNCPACGTKLLPVEGNCHECGAAIGTEPCSGESNESAPFNPIQETRAEPIKIGGWLILPAVGLVLGAIVSLINLVRTYAALPLVAKNFSVVLLLLVVAQHGLFFYLLVVANRFFRRRKDAPESMISLLFAPMWVSGILLLSALGIGAFPAAALFFVGMVIGAVPAAIWIPYFRRSKRVKRTFLHDA